MQKQSGKVVEDRFGALALAKSLAAQFQKESPLNIDLDAIKQRATAALRAIHQHYPDLVAGRDPMAVVSVLHGNHNHLDTTAPTLHQMDIGDDMTADQRGKYSALSGYKAMIAWLGLPQCDASAILANPDRWIYAGGISTEIGEEGERIAIGFSGQLAAIDHLIATSLMMLIVPAMWYERNRLARMVKLPGYDPDEILKHLSSRYAP